MVRAAAGLSLSNGTAVGGVQRGLEVREGLTPPVAQDARQGWGNLDGGESALTMRRIS